MLDDNKLRSTAIRPIDREADNSPGHQYSTKARPATKIAPAVSAAHYASADSSQGLPLQPYTDIAYTSA